MSHRFDSKRTSKPTVHVKAVDGDWQGSEWVGSVSGLIRVPGRYSIGQKLRLFIELPDGSAEIETNGEVETIDEGQSVVSFRSFRRDTVEAMIAYQQGADWDNLPPGVHKFAEFKGIPGPGRRPSWLKRYFEASRAKENEKRASLGIPLLPSLDH